MIGFTTLITLAVAAVSVSATPVVERATPCTTSGSPTPTSAYPIGRRAPKGLGALAERKRRYFGVAWDVNRAVDSDYTQLVLAQVRVTLGNSRIPSLLTPGD